MFVKQNFERLHTEYHVSPPNPVLFVCGACVGHSFNGTSWIEQW